MLRSATSGRNYQGTAAQARTAAGAAQAATSTSSDGSSTNTGDTGPSISVSGTADNNTATNNALILSGAVYYPSPASASTSGIVSPVTIANGAQAVVGQPDVPRKLQIAITDANSSITAGTVTVACTGASGESVSDVTNIANGGTHTYTTGKACATISSITVASLAGAGAGDTIGVGPATALGLPVAQSPAGASCAVHEEAKFSAGTLTKESAASVTVDASACTAIPVTVPNGSLGFLIMFSYSVTPTQAAHGHNVTGVSATQAAHHHPGNTHSHTQQ